MRKAKPKALPKLPPVSEESLPNASTSTESGEIQGEPTGLPEYNPNAVCVKCRSNYAETKYEKNFSQVGPSQVAIMERMERTCGRCGFVWYENVVG